MTGGRMTEREEQIVRDFLDVFEEGDIAGSARCFARDASYRMNAWNEPIVGVDAIRAEFLRQEGLWSDFRFDLLNIASTGSVVFTERVDRGQWRGKDMAVHVAGVFEIDEDGKITAWRDYYDPQEVESQHSG